MERYLDRHAAGKILATELKAYAKRGDTVVLGLPRGGVPVAFEVAETLHLPLDVFIVRKLGVPGHEELAFGAIAANGVQILNDNVVSSAQISQKVIDQVVAVEQEELKRREKAYRDDRPPVDVTNKVVILVDDGIATGATIRAAVTSLRASNPSLIIIAVPVAEMTTCEKMALIADKVVCPLKPIQFYAVGAHYVKFDQTSDEEVKTLLEKSRSFA